MIRQVESEPSKKLKNFTTYDRNLFHNGCLWVPTSNLINEVICLNHDHLLLGHPGITSNINLVKKIFIVKIQVFFFKP